MIVFQGWTAVDASVVCKMLGLVIHPDDWRIYETNAGPDSQPLWRSSVSCIDLDMDLMQCAADERMDHSCNHTRDVSVRCYKPTWAGNLIRAWLVLLTYRLIVCLHHAIAANYSSPVNCYEYSNFRNTVVVILKNHVTHSGKVCYDFVCRNSLHSHC